MRLQFSQIIIKLIDTLDYLGQVRELSQVRLSAKFLINSNYPSSAKIPSSDHWEAIAPAVFSSSNR